MRAAFYEKDITPPLGGFIAGFYQRIFATDVLDPLYVKAAVLDNDINTVIIVAIDSCEFPDDLHDTVVKRIEEYTGVKSENIMICINHTHKGIPITDAPELDCYADMTYKDVAYRLIADCAILAYSRLFDADISFGKSKAEGIAFNRNFVMRDGTYRTWQYDNRENIVKTLAPVDEEVPVLLVKDNDGKEKGAIVSFACHNDVNPGTAYSGGFASVLSNEMKKKYGNDFVTVFLAGACGDINWVNPETYPDEPDEKTYIKMGNVLADAVIDANANSEPVLKNILWSKKDRIALPKRNLTEAEIKKELTEFSKRGETISIRNMLYYLATNDETEKEVYVQCIKIGDVLIYGYSGEIFVNFGLELKAKSPTDKVIISTLTNCGCGYVATKEAFEENSLLYETKLCYGACLDKDAGYIMNEKLLEMAGEM